MLAIVITGKIALGYSGKKKDVLNNKPMSISSGYGRSCGTPSDIYEHLPTLAKYASECTHVTECGVGSAFSSYALAYGLKDKPESKLVQVDVKTNPETEEFQRDCASEGFNTVFFQMSDLECPLEDTDLLFIDTWHVYGQLKRELARWHPCVRKYIILHDTVVDGLHGEAVRMNKNIDEWSRMSGFPSDEIRKGLVYAVNEFLAEHCEWVVHAHFMNNNGLTVLTRYRTAE
jgi:hypothetical protein